MNSMHPRAIRTARCLLSVSFASYLAAGVARGHSLGNEDADLTPPMLMEAEELKEVNDDFGGAAPVMRGVLDSVKIWSAGSTLTGCFYDGEPKLKAFFAKVAQEWLPGLSLRMDFGREPNFRDCNGPADIRISFSQKNGNWSFVGADSLRPEVVKNGASLNIETDGIPFDKLNRIRLRETILHEMGHALGLVHEHQSPEAHCGNELNWPKVYDYYKRLGWDENKVKTNFAQYYRDQRLRTTRYDRKSIMHYSLPEWMFKNGTKAQCYVPQPTEISKLDRTIVASAYPATAAQQNKNLQELARSAGSAMANLDLDTLQLAKIGERMAGSLKHFRHKLKLQFALASDGVVRRSVDPATLNPCSGNDLRLPAAPVSCGVAPDGSVLVIEVDPSAPGQ